MVGRGGSLPAWLAVALLVGLVGCGGWGTSPPPSDRALASPQSLDQTGPTGTPSASATPTAGATSTARPQRTSAASGSPPGCWLFILAGQSNMAGYGRYDALPPGDDGALPKNVTLVAVSLDVHLRPLQGGFGPELGLARTLAREYPAQQLLLVKYAVEASSLLDWAPDWDPEAATRTGHPEYGPLYRQLLDMVAAERKAPEGLACQPVALLWMQGERDALFPPVAVAYETNLTALIHALRTDLGVPALPFLVGQVDPPRDRYPAADLVRAAQAAVADSVPAVYLVRTEGLSRHADGLHYDTAGQLELGRRFASAYLAVP